MGRVTISERTGMLKTYDLIDRHFGWETPPKPASVRETAAHLLDRALRAQGVVSLDSACYGDVSWKPLLRSLIETKVRKKELVPVAIDGAGKQEHWARSEILDAIPSSTEAPVHILSPFDPLVIQRKRLSLFFGYDHVFEAYVPKPKRRYGYFALPVLVGDRIVAVLDLKTDRAAGKLLVQQWSWIGDESRSLKRRIEEELGRFERFQLAHLATARTHLILVTSFRHAFATRDPRPSVPRKLLAHATSAHLPCLRARHLHDRRVLVRNGVCGAGQGRRVPAPHRR